MIYLGNGYILLRMVMLYEGTVLSYTILLYSYGSTVCCFIDTVLPYIALLSSSYYPSWVPPLFIAVLSTCTMHCSIKYFYHVLLFWVINFSIQRFYLKLRKQLCPIDETLLLYGWWLCSVEKYTLLRKRFYHVLLNLYGYTMHWSIKYFYHVLLTWLIHCSVQWFYHVFHKHYWSSYRVYMQ